MHYFKLKIVPFFLLCITAIPIFFSFYFIVKRIIIRQEMAITLTQRSSQTIVVNETDVVWTETGKELLLAGRLFDVISFIKHGTTLQITGIFDSKEDDLQLHLNKLVDQKQGSDNLLVAGFLQQTLFKSDHNFDKVPAFFFVINHLGFPSTDKILSIDSEILIPPPKA
ncbi:MAG: hypothetical protein H0W12_04680 [Chitinophagaceae bacterium]|nr:hypothetical protein [Chitinophagaceae bacterium]